MRFKIASKISRQHLSGELYLAIGIFGYATTSFIV